MLYSLKEITIIPTKISDIDSRSECNPYYEEMLPLFTAPMSAVIGVNSWKDYMNNRINSIIPRNISLVKRLYYLSNTTMFVAFGLEEIKEQFIINNYTDYNQFFHILIDIANGNMKKVFDLVKQLKEKYNNDVVIMAGNIANPETYEEYCKAGIDYCRVGIGGGSSCNTSTFTGIHYPMGSLLKECNKIKGIHNHFYENFPNIINSAYTKQYPATKIIADGGIKGYADIIKCLALGADYVMCGSVFAKMKESEAPIYHKNTNNNLEFKQFYGMSTPKAQIELGGDGSKATEGNETLIPVEYTMEEWVNNFTAYLKSTMSYCGKRTLSEFIGKVQTEIMSENSINSINK